MNIYIETLGCPKNTVDSENAAGLLEKAGHVITDIEAADVIVVNTCAFINDAKQESIDTILTFGAFAKEENKTLVVSGCLGQRYNEDLFKQIPEADIIIGVNEYQDLPLLIEDYQKNKIRLKLKNEPNGQYEEISCRKRSASYTGLLRISEGCDNCCTYCVIPSIRGGFRSRRFEAIVSEAEMMAKSGCKEITLIAQDVTNYGIDLYGKYRLPELVSELCKINEIKWIRLMYCYSDKITDELIDVMARSEKVCRYIDIPIQHGADNVLKSMGRKATQSSIKNTIRSLREKVPDIHIRTTLIVGFPGESKEDFQELENFVREMKFDRLGVFAYSKEEGTPAGKMKNQVRAATKIKRRDRIMELQREISLAKNEAKVGQMMEVLVEEKLEGEWLYMGRSQHDAHEIDNAVMVSASRELAIGEFVKVKITDAFDYDLTGCMIEEGEQE